MDLYLSLLSYPVFTKAEVYQLSTSENAGSIALWRLMKQGYVLKIRNNLYTCIHPVTKMPNADRFQIACAISTDAYISHISALEYYGLYDQIQYEVYVSCTHKFNDFQFEGYHYHYVPSKSKLGIFSPQMGIKITDIEKTLIDSIKDANKIGGIESVIAAIELMNDINEEKLLLYLQYYNHQFLYQKTGLILKQFKEQFGLSQGFFDICKQHIGKSKRYLCEDMKCDTWIGEYQIMVPSNLFQLKNGEEQYEIRSFDISTKC